MDATIASSVSVDEAVTIVETLLRRFGHRWVLSVVVEALKKEASDLRNRAADLDDVAKNVWGLL